MSTVALVGAGSIFSAPVAALEVTGTLDVDTLASILFPGGDGLEYTPGAGSLSGFSDTGSGGESLISAGTFTNATGTYGIGTGLGGGPEGIVLSSGNVLDYGDGPNFFSATTTNYNDPLEMDLGIDFDSGLNLGVPATTAQNDLLSPITGFADHYDVTQIDIPFVNTTGGATTLDLAAVFGSEEFPDYVATNFNDGFGVYLNGTNIALVGGLPTNIDHPAMTPIVGTELNGILAPDGTAGIDPRLHFTGTVNDGSNVLTLVIADTSDGVLDSTVYLSREHITGPVSGIPRLPDRIDPDTGGFIFDPVDAGAGEPVVIDPFVATGYDYAAIGSLDTPDPKFSTVTVNPTVTASSFTISFDGFVEAIDAGMPFDLSAFVPAGVSEFTISDIPVDDMLPPDNALAFVTTVTFSTAVSGISITQTPITTFVVVPEPGVIGMLGLSIVAMLGRRPGSHRI